MEGFKSQFQKGALPDDIPEITLSAEAVPNMLKDAGLVSSTSEAIRMIKAHAVKVDGKIFENHKDAPVSGIWQVGKRRFVKITLN